MKTITAYEIKPGDTIQTLDGHIFRLVDVTYNDGAGEVTIVGQQKNTVTLSAAQGVSLFSLQEHCHDIGEYCGDEDCMDCSESCEHVEHDHGICLDCEKDISDDLIGKAEDAYEGER